MSSILDGIKKEITQNIDLISDDYIEQVGNKQDVSVNSFLKETEIIDSIGKRMAKLKVKMIICEMLDKDIQWQDY